MSAKEIAITAWNDLQPGDHIVRRKDWANGTALVVEREVPEWKPGTFADITNGSGEQVRAIRVEAHDGEQVWQTIPNSSWWSDANVTDVRPLVVIDPATVDWRGVQSQMSVLVVGAEPFKRAGEILDVVRRELGIEVAR